LTFTPTQASRRTAIPSPATASADWGVAEEVPVEIGFNGQAWTVMMATPTHIEDLAAGLAITEGAITNGTDIESIDVQQYPEGITADIRLPAELLKPERIRRRSLDGRTGCGLCGVETLAELHRPAPALKPSVHIPTTAVRRAFNELPDHQPLNAETRSVHAAAWCSTQGDIMIVREDVGRHNALDKLAGARLGKSEPDDAGFVILSSRCSFELVFKAARMRASLLASLSAPTGLALDLAKALNLDIATVGASNEIIIFPAETTHG
jgi:FdhD protein